MKEIHYHNLHQDFHEDRKNFYRYPPAFATVSSSLLMDLRYFLKAIVISLTFTKSWASKHALSPISCFSSGVSWENRYSANATAV